MILASLVSFLVGSALGAGFRVWILIPVSFASVLFFVLGTSHPFGWLASIPALQIGYFIGALLFRGALRKAGPERAPAAYAGDRSHLTF